MDGNNIIIKQSYFTNIQTAINSLNEFCSSGFKVKNFPVLDGDFQLDATVERILSRLECVDPTWLEDEGKMNGIIEMINENISQIDPVDGVYSTIINSNNEMMIKAIDAYIGFKILQVIADNFQDFIKLINGIYTFELFTSPDKFTDVMDKFGQFVSLSEIPELDLEEKIFDEGFYVDGVFKNEQIQLPQSMDIEAEVERIINRTPLEGYEIFVDDSVQEAAEINYFTETKPKHMKYSTKTKKWMVSNQFSKTVDELVAALRKCDSTDDLLNFFKGDFWKTARDFSETVVPYILVKVFDNPKKFDGKFNTDNYAKSYASIIKQNNGAKRFQNYDIFTTFKSDKEGTIKFIEDFFKLKLVNDPDAAITNNTILTLFNIFDSRIYLDIVYNHAPENIKSEKTEDQFVKEVRGKINKNSHTAKTYTNSEEAQDPAPEDKVDDSKTVSEYVVNELHKLGDMSISDMQNCNQFSYIVECDIDTLGDKMYNSGISPFLIEEYIGESYNAIDPLLHDFVQEANIQKKRETFQQGVCSLMANMEEIVKLDKQHRWNANSFGSRYKMTFNPMTFLGLTVGSITNSSEEHTNIKQVYHSTRKALKGKRGGFTSEQMAAIRKLNELAGDLWANVKMFWINPRNWAKEINLMKNDKTQKRTRKIADIARAIVAMKPQLEFIIENDDFVNECWYDGDPDYIFQEATTEKNRERLRTAISLLMRDMQKIADLAKNKQWTNNACISLFKNETKGNIKQALKYANRGYSGSCGSFDEQNKGTLKSLAEKLEELIRTVKLITINPLIGKNVKEAGNVHKIATLANDILGMKSSLEFVNDAVVKDAPSSPVNASAEEIKTESFEYNIDKFRMIMEQETGEIPEYMKTRFKMTDKIGATVSPTDAPVPQNPVPELADSIDAKLDTGGDTLGDMLGSGFENNPNKDKADGKIVVNVTNNYTNSFNRDSNNTTTNTTTKDDHSTGKTTNTTVTNTNSNNKTNSDNDNSRDKQTDSSSNKSVKKSNVKKTSTDNSDNSDHSKKSSTKASNNNNNSNDSADLKDSPTKKDGEQKLSSGKTVQEMFMFLESKEPQSSEPNATLLTKAMDRDREKLPKQQKMKHGVQNIANTGKAVLKPVTRTKQWLTKVVDSLIKNDEDKVKASLIENKSYRSAVYKASRVAIKLGLISVAASIQPYLGLTVAGIEGLKLADRNRLKKEVQQEMESELEVIDEKIKDLDRMNTPEARKDKYELMRMKKKFEQNLISAPRRKVASSYWDAY